MINARKQVSTYLLEAESLFEDIFIPVNSRQGFIRSKSPKIPIYFYRYIGISESKEIYYETLHKLNNELSALKDLYLNFNGIIPIKPLRTSITEICWSALLLPSSSERYNLITTLRARNLFPNFKTGLFNDYIENGFDEIIDLYLANEPNTSETVMKNFAVKLLGWIMEFAPKLFKDCNYNPKVNENIINPKVVFYGEIKKHEVYFLILLSRLGCDVIYINSLEDMEFLKIDKSHMYSRLIRLSDTEPLSQLDFKIQTTNNTPKEMINKFEEGTVNHIQPVMAHTTPITLNESLSLDLTFKDSINTILKSSMNIFDDLILPINKRIGFISGLTPFIPVYFYRYIGINQNEDEYYNDLFRLDKTLGILDGLYLKFTDSIPISPNSKVITSTLNIWQYIDISDNHLATKLAALLMEHNVFPTNNHNLNSSMANGFSFILDLYCKEEKDLNLSKVRNFSLKILSWIYDFVPTLVRNFDFQNTSLDDIANPKIIYYGNIKKHELLFLVLLSKLGCDVLYINSSYDGISNTTDYSDLFSIGFEFPYKADLKEFPKEELLVRQETVALRASRELSTALYTDQDGFYKPWQFENYKTHPTTLKTTFHELKILWNESSSLRTGFKVENSTVYIPNLFAKISGIHSDLDLYWKDFFHLKSAENTIFISEVPFTNVTYSKPDLYSLAFVLDNNGFIDAEKLLTHSSYKFSHLKTSLQQIILEKINYLIKTDMLKITVDKELKLKILMTILNLDKGILQLIQQYDYPSKVPKLLIYANTESIFSDEDAITLCFLNLFGFDITILTPTGYNNIEGKIKEKFYDIHRLESIDFNLALPDLIYQRKYTREKSKGFLSNIFKLK